MMLRAARLGASLACILALASLGACSLLSRPTPPAVYRLAQTTASPQASNTATSVWSLQIATPQASASINRSAITVLPQPDQINSYRGARWSDPAPILFRDALVRQLQQSHPLAIITSDDSDVPTRFKLVGRLDAFQSEYHGGTPRIVVHYQAQLLTADAQHTVASRGFDITIIPASAQIPEVVAGFSQAVQQLSSQLQQWLSGALTGPAAASQASNSSP